MIQQILFILITLLVFGIAFRKYAKLRRNILLGQDEDVSGQAGRRWRNVLLVAFGQKKMFKNWLPALFHFFIYAAFLITQIELIEILIDGFSGEHRIFATSLGGFYTFIISAIEVLSLLALVATVIFLIRRNLLYIPRFRKAEMTSWPKLDANLILYGEILLIVGIFSMNGADTLLQGMDAAHYPDTGFLAVSGWMGPLLFGGLEQSTLAGLERFGWWLHILTVFGFILYLPYSKHLHIFLAFPNTYFERLKPAGKMDNMPEIMNEVKSMMGLDENGAEPAMDMEAELPEFGSNDVFSLSWKNIMEAYSCTECGRCTAACPANITGKKLSPRKIMMDIRDRAEEVGAKIDSGDKEYAKDPEKPLSRDNFDDGRSLFDYITGEELHACTTCNACVEACPVLINPLDPILKMRRYEILTLSQGPSDWMPMFNSIENGGAAWAMTTDRDQWVKDLNGRE